MYIIYDITTKIIQSWSDQPILVSSPYDIAQCYTQLSEQEFIELFPEDFTDGAHYLIDGQIVRDEELYATLQEIKIRTLLRNRRSQECFPIINRGLLWYNTLSEEQLQDLTTWYHQWLDVTETLAAPTKPDWLDTETA